MPAQLLIYESVAPLARAKHGRWSVEVGADYTFSKSVNSVPLMAAEFLSAVPEYAIVFAGTGDAILPTVILGMRADQNLYLTEQGGWEARYIPAFVRRYPFVFARSADGKTFTLCVDESFRGINQEGRGQRLFQDDGKPTPYVQNVLKFLEQYQVEHRRTEGLCRKLRELNLLEPMRAQFKLPSGEELALSGFMVVSRDRLKALAADALAELARSDQLELIYLHLQSLHNFTTMPRRPARAASAAEGEKARSPARPRPGPAKGARRRAKK
jgi:hypothetical protein